MNKFHATKRLPVATVVFVRLVFIVCFCFVFVYILYYMVYFKSILQINTVIYLYNFRSWFLAPSGEYTWTSFRLQDCTRLISV